MVPTSTCRPSNLMPLKLYKFLVAIAIAGLMMLIPRVIFAQIAAWDFTGVVATAPPANFAATTFDANLVSSSGANLVTRGATAGPSNGGNSFRTTGFKNDGVATTNTDYFQITLSAATGYQLSLSTIDAKFRGTASFCATPGVTHMFAYSLDGVTFTSTGTQVTIGGSSPAGTSIVQVNVGGILALQNVPTGTTVYLRYYAAGQTATGGWGFYSSAAGSNGLAIGGSVTLASSNTIATGAVASTPFALPNCAATAAGTVAFTSVGTFVGNTYTAQLSDAAGSFAAPVNIGTLVSNANAGSINITIPAATPTSALYKIRVISSGPSVVGSPSAAFSINQSGACTTTATDWFQSKATGAWGTAANWQSSSDFGVTWITATAAPTSAATRITINSGHTMTVAAAASGDFITVAAGANITVNAGITFTLGIAALPSNDLDVFGTVINAGVISTGTAKVTFEAGSLYQHTANAAGNAIVTATWNAASTCAVSGMTGVGPTTASIGQTFGNFIWGCAAQTTPYSINTNSFATQGKFTVDTTGVSPANYLSLTGGVGTNNTNAFGSLDVNGGILNLVSNTSASTLINTAIVSGDVTVTGGTLSLAAGTSDGALAGRANVGFLKIGGNLSVSGSPASFWASNSSVNHRTVGRVEFTKAGTQTAGFTNTGASYGFVNYMMNNGSTLQVLAGGIPLRSTGPTEFDTLTVNSGGTIDFGASGTLYQSSGTDAGFFTNNLSTVITSNVNGLIGPATNGSIQTGLRTFAVGTSYTFNGATLTAFPTTVQQPTFGNPLNVTLGANITLNRAIIATGTVALGANVLTQGGSNLGFSGMTGAGSVVGDNTCGITVNGVTAASPGTLRLSGSQTTAQINMNRAGTLTLGSDVNFDGQGAFPAAGNTLLLTSGTVDATGRSLSFINTTTRVPISRTAGFLTVSNSTNITLGLPGFTAGNASSFPASMFTTSPVSINNLTINRGSQYSLNNQPFIINGTLTLTLGTFNNNNNILTFQNGAVPIVKTGGTLTMGASGTGSLVFGTVGNTGGANATIPNGTFTVVPTLDGFTMNRSNTLTLGNQGFTINSGKALNIISGTLDALTNTINGLGDLTMTGGVLKLGKNAGATALPELAGTYTLTGGGIEFSGNGAGVGNEQTLKALNYNDLTFSGGGDRILPNSGTVGIKGALTASTNVTTVTGSLVDFNGGNQTVPAFTTANAAPYAKQFNSVKFSGTGTKTLADNFTMLDSLKIYTGVTLAVGNNAVTLKSGLTQTARVAAVEGTGNITYGASGKFIVERYIPAHRAWRLMCAPLQAGEQTVNAAWQEGAATTASNPSLGYGTHISGGPGKTEAMGYDLGPNSSSVFGYNAGTGSWNVIPATTNAFDINLKPLMLFVRGSRAINLPASNQYTVADNTTLRPSGKINLSGTYSFSATAGFAACVNPVAAPINFHNLSKSGIIGGVGGDAYYMWDPNLTGSNGVGAWVSFSWNGTNYDQTVLAGPGTTSIANTGVIPSGAAFMVNQSGSGTLDIAQKDVTTDAGGQPYVFRPVTGRSNLRASLFALNADATKSLNDGALVVFANGYSNAVNNEDMMKLDNFSESISMIHNGKKIAIERRAPAGIRDTIFFSLGKMKQKNYELQLDADRFLHNATLKAYLQDKFANTQTLISTGSITSYGFAVTADAASSSADRFKIVFKRSGVPPVLFSSVRGINQGKDISLEWNVTNEEGIEGYEIERSADGGQTFVKLTEKPLTANANSEGLNMYNWLDINPAKGDNFYKVKGIAANGTSNYSELVKVCFAAGSTPIAVYPNPIVNNTIGLQMNTMPSGTYLVKLLNQDGQVVLSDKINHTSLKNVEQVSLNKGVPSGVYQLQVVKPGGEIIALKLVK